jgi:hypothetical protein
MYAFYMLTFSACGASEREPAAEVQELHGQSRRPNTAPGYDHYHYASCF